jgi:hypothetical protein
MSSRTFVLYQNNLEFLQKHSLNQKPSHMTKNSFIYKYCIGRGGFGKVWKI